VHEGIDRITYNVGKEGRLISAPKSGDIRNVLVRVLKLFEDIIAKQNQYYLYNILLYRHRPFTIQTHQLNDTSSLFFH
jgi:hypothetical protein